MRTVKLTTVQGATRVGDITKADDEYIWLGYYYYSWDHVESIQTVEVDNEHN